MNPSILIADDHPLILKGLEDYLKERNHNVIASAKNGKEALTLIKGLKPDIAILDIQMPFYTGLEIAEFVKENGLDTKVALITLEKDEAIYNKAIDLDVFGYILKEFALDEIELCIESIIADQPYFSPELAEFIEPLPVTPEALKDLTPGEKKILKLIAQEKTAKEIANELSISSRTVEKHKTNIRSHLKLDSKPTSILLLAKKYEDYLSKI